MYKNLQQLIEAIDNNLPNVGKLEDIISIVEKYDADDWNVYVKFDQNKYNRTMIYQNNKFEILVICWDTNQNSGIHDHPLRGCILKCLHGNLIEELYKRENLEKYGENILKPGSVSYREGIEGLHNIVNQGEQSVTLHIYSPPKYIPNRY